MFIISMDKQCNKRRTSQLFENYFFKKILKAVEGWIIFVRNIHEESNEEDIFDAFSEFGEILNLNLNLDHQTGFTKGYAFIEFKTKQEGENAIESMNEKEYREKKLKVSWAFKK
jgi:RNA-binding protein 8A